MYRSMKPSDSKSATTVKAFPSEFENQYSPWRERAARVDEKVGQKLISATLENVATVDLCLTLSNGCSNVDSTRELNHCYPDG